MHLLEVHKHTIKPAERLLKRVIDVGFALLLLVALSPVFLLTALLVAFTSPGPVFYRQPRVGRNGRTFRIFKFRTMTTGADKHGPSVTSADDNRITTVGRILRRTKLDELPQLLNVVLGDMSIVGPRPQVQRFVDRFDPQLRSVALSVRPGVTGITALCFRNEEEMLADIPDRESYYIQNLLPVKLEMDAWYVTTRGVRGDLYILGATAWLLTVPRLVNLVKRSRQPREHEITEKVINRYLRYSKGDRKSHISHPSRFLQTPQLQRIPIQQQPQQQPAPQPRSREDSLAGLVGSAK